MHGVEFKLSGSKCLDHSFFLQIKDYSCYFLGHFDMMDLPESHAMYAFLSSSFHSIVKMLAEDRLSGSPPAHS